MVGLRLYGPAALTMGVPNPVADRPEVVYHCLAVSKDRFEYPFLVLVRCQVELFGSEGPQLRQVRVVRIQRAGIVEDVLANGLK
jgi:hypothetical protein